MHASSSLGLGSSLVHAAADRAVAMAAAAAQQQEAHARAQQLQTQAQALAQEAHAREAELQAQAKALEEAHAELANLLPPGEDTTSATPAPSAARPPPSSSSSSAWEEEAKIMAQVDGGRQIMAAAENATEQLQRAMSASASSSTRQPILPTPSTTRRHSKDGCVSASHRISQDVIPTRSGMFCGRRRRKR